MATKPLNANLAADLPTNWQIGQTIAPNGSDAGLSEQHGYNYQSAQINAAQQAVNTINDAFETVAASVHQHSASAITSGVLPVERGGTGNTTGNAVTASSCTGNAATASSCTGNSATATKLQTARNINGVAFDGTKNITITAAPNAHNQGAGTITAGALAVGVVATAGTDYTTYRLRNISANTTAMTAGSTALTSGNIYLHYE